MVGKVMSDMGSVSTVVVTGLAAQFSKLIIMSWLATENPEMTTNTQKNFGKSFVLGDESKTVDGGILQKTLEHTHA